MADVSHTVWMPGGVRTEIHATGEDTGGAFCLLVDEPPAGWSLPPHLHRDAAETILVLDGSFDVEVDDAQTRLEAGASIHIPRGVVHASANTGPRTGRRVVLFSPAGMERFFMEAGAAVPDTDVDLAAALAAATRHGWEFVR
ncbi:MAG TPA: cupin domain-containing protein [Conexibacter sp.]|jgi:quercetin dioxygenase-like cupin family protein|nr:cupin domain-containing protein [Conexibacter sp.]